MIKISVAIGAGLLLALGLGGCGGAHSSERPRDDSVRVVTSATMVTDMVEAIGGDLVRVDGLMGPGIDPHLYRPSVMDLRRLSRADAVFFIGLRFEELLEDVLQQRARAGQKVFALGEGVPKDLLLPSHEEAGLFDPHIWFDASIWAHCVDVVVRGLSELLPDHAAIFEENGERYRQQLLDLHQWALDTAATLPENDRILVTSHDAYNYFGQAYGFEVVGLLGISTASEAGLADITRLVDFIRERQIPAIFVETSVSPRALERVSRDSGAKIGGELFSDALGARGDIRGGHDVGTYEGMMRYNLSTIVEALRR